MMVTCVPVKRRVNFTHMDSHHSTLSLLLLPATFVRLLLLGKPVKLRVVHLLVTLSKLLIRPGQMVIFDTLLVRFARLDRCIKLINFAHLLVNRLARLVRCMMMIKHAIS
jgi:hypothetical protein